MRYDGAEIGICINWTDAYGDQISERTEVTPEQAQAIVEDPEQDGETWCWSVYWHCTEGGCEWVADFDPVFKEDAHRLYNAMMAAALLARSLPQHAMEHANLAVSDQPIS